MKFLHKKIQLILTLTAVVVFVNVDYAKDTNLFSNRLQYYLTNTVDSPKEKAAVLEVIKNAQVIKLNYEQNQPADSPDDDVKSLFATRIIMASDVSLLSTFKDGKRYPGISATFNNFLGYAKEMDPNRWLEEMKKPVKAGYKLTSVSIITAPPETIKNRSLKASQEAAKQLSQEIEKMKTDFSQLKTFSAAKDSNLGGWGKSYYKNWPAFPFIHYNQNSGYIDNMTIKKESEDWCLFSFDMSPISGILEQMGPSGARTYSMQGVDLRWFIHSGNVEFNKKISEAVNKSLKPLDDLETELEKEQKKGQKIVPSDANEKKLLLKDN
jgi:hypothetical protein